jgi:mono/diheme cytochrome c family protein
MNKMTRALALTSAIALAATAAYAEDAKTIFESKCAACHGKAGDGATKVGAKLGIRDFTDPKVQAALKDDEMAKAIKEGVKEWDKTKMKGFGDKLSEDDVKALVAYIRTLKK